MPGTNEETDIIIDITATWNDDNQWDTVILMYKIYRKDWVSCTDGGVALEVKESIESE